MSLKILATADIHIGRRPSRLADPDDGKRFSCARMWGAVVERAICENVDLVALCGDIVDHGNRFFEATGPLERGLRRLAEHGIHTYAVAGNHDYDVLPRIVDMVGGEHFHLLGRGGSWEEAVFQSDDGRRLRIHGWSFPAVHVATSPLLDYDLVADGDPPVLGLIHADLGVPESRYAPVARSELESCQVALWLLGHVHLPSYFEATSAPPILYPGSPQAMDPGETGAHGPWLIEIHGAHRVSASLLAISKVRYDELEVDLTGIGTKEQFESQVSACVRDHLAALADEDGPLEYLSLRLELTGRTALCGQIAECAGPLQEQFDRAVGDVAARIEKVINNTRSEIDLDELAQKHDPPGVLAGTLQKLQSGQADESLRMLLQQAHQEMLKIYRARTYERIAGGPTPDLESARQCLLRQGLQLLETLRAQERSR